MWNRPGEMHPLHTVNDTGAYRADILLHEPCDRVQASAQPYGQGRNPDEGFREYPACGLLLLPYQPGCRHHRIQGHHCSCRRGPGADAGADPRNSPPFQRNLRRGSGRATDSPASELCMHETAGNRRQGQDEQVARQLHLPFRQP